MYQSSVHHTAPLSIAVRHLTVLGVGGLGLVIQPRNKYAALRITPILLKMQAFFLHFKMQVGFLIAWYTSVRQEISLPGGPLVYHTNGLPVIPRTVHFSLKLCLEPVYIYFFIFSFDMLLMSRWRRVEANEYGLSLFCHLLLLPLLFRNLWTWKHIDVQS